MRGMRRFAWMAAAAICAAVPSLAAEGQASLRSCGMRSVCGLSGISARDSLRTSVPADRRFLPTSRRIDRGINDICYAYKGEMAIGFAASYGTLTSDDTDLMLILDGIDMKGSVFTLNPSFGYFIKDNICLGVRFGYTRTQGTLGHVSLNLGSANDISMSLSDVGFKNRMTTMGAFMRSYAGVDPKGHFGLFGELELTCRMGTSVLSSATEGGVTSPDGSNMQVRIAFSSGVAVYIFPNVCCTLSFGLGGFQFSKVNQKDAAGNVTGSRQASKLLLRLNLADIKIGLNFHL